jgi:preprotein translocase subunit Sec63
MAEPLVEARRLFGQVIGGLILVGVITLIGKVLFGSGRKHRAAEEQQRASGLANTLGVSINATQEEIQVAYLKKMQLYQPERLMGLETDLRKKAELDAKKIISAFEELKKYKAMSA